MAKPWIPEISIKDCAHCRMPFTKDPRNTWAYWRKQVYCSAKCSGLARSAAADANRSPMAVEFARWHDRGEGCWNWQGAIDRDGYGAFSYAGKTKRAHRVAMILDGRDPGKLFACHSCDNPRCVRPDHLFAGSNQDNMRDMVAKGRNPDRFGPNNPNWKGGKSRRTVANG